MSVIEQVATEPCHRCEDLWDVMEEAFGGYCDNCGNTKLQWPELSKEKKGVGHDPNSVDGNKTITYRVPDMTLEKVLFLLSGDWMLRYDRDTKTFCMVDDVGDFDTPLEAVCAALLGSVKNE